MNGTETEVTTPSSRKARAFFIVGIIFEGGLALVGIGLAHLLGVPHPAQAIGFDLASFVQGCLATIPLVLAMFFCLSVPWRRCREIIDVLRQQLLPLAKHWSIFEIFLIAALAGFGEEVLFRGVIQRAIVGEGENLNRTVLAVGITSLLFGQLHAVTFSYGVFASLVGVYLGTVFLLTENLLVPIVAHGLYDFIALLYLTRLYQGQPATGSS